MFCYHATINDAPSYSKPGVPRCPVNEMFPLVPGQPQDGYVSWFFDPAPKLEESLIAASGDGEWNVEIAIYNDAGQWDSKFGSNYKFTL